MLRSDRTRLVLPALLLVVLFAGCGGGPEGEPINVSAREYAFEGLPGNLEAGPFSFTLINKGSEVHELHLYRLAEGAGTARELAGLSDEDLLDELESVGITSANPGDEGSFDAELPAGRYLAVCFVPVGTTPDEGHSGHEMKGEAHELGPDAHFRKGMSAEITVT